MAGLNFSKDGKPAAHSDTWADVQPGSNSWNKRDNSVTSGNIELKKKK